MKARIITLFATSLICGVLSAGEVDTPPQNIIKNYEWCLATKPARKRLQRFEAFWARFHPNNEEYGDMIEGTYVRLTAYRLALLYAQTGNLTKCAEFLDWLETHDHAIPR